jgi:hypothetical protein
VLAIGRGTGGCIAAIRAEQLTDERPGRCSNGLNIEARMPLARLKSVVGVTIPDTGLCNAAVDLSESSSPEFLINPRSLWGSANAAKARTTAKALRPSA